MTRVARRLPYCAIMHHSLRFAVAVFVSALTGCGGGGGDNPSSTGPPPALEESRTFRAIAGVSMGAYGAMNLGTKHPELFGTIASLGGPVDMTQLLRDSLDDNLEVKPQTDLPRAVDDDFTFDHLPPYPDRDTRITMFQDLSIAFGNPFLHHADPQRQYLASDSEPALLRIDDQFGAFEVLAEPRGFLDGGDRNKDGLRQSGEAASLPSDTALLAVGSLPTIVSGAAPVEVGGRHLADLDGDGIFDVGEGLVLNLAEPFEDSNGNRVFEPALGERYSDSGLDGVAGTGDFGEGNATFDYDPDRATWIDEDPFSRLAARDAAAIATQRMYMDVGTRDEFGFARHYENLIALLESKGLAVATEDGFDTNCADLPGPDDQFLLTRYDAGHIGVDAVDPDGLLDGNVCGEDTVWQRILNMMGYLNESFPDGVLGPGSGGDLPDLDLDDLDFDLPNLDVTGKVSSVSIASAALATGGAAPTRRVVVYRPPAFFRSDETFPVVYFLGGYGQEPEDFRRIGVLLDGLILTGQMQNMFFVFLPGDGGRKGSFYVNHRVPHDQVPELQAPTSGRYEDSIIQDLIPFIEDRVLKRRVRR